MTITDSELPVLRFSVLAAAFPRLRALAAKRAGVEELEAGEEKMEELVRKLPKLYLARKDSKILPFCRWSVEQESYIYYH